HRRDRSVSGGARAEPPRASEETGAEARSGGAEDDDARVDVPVAARYGRKDDPEFLRRAGWTRSGAGPARHVSAAYRTADALVRSARAAHLLRRADEERQGLRAVSRDHRRVVDERRPDRTRRGRR